ncbi:MAG: serine/threonine-protein kinase [Kofleriaceae bacterium]
MAETLAEVDPLIGAQVGAYRVESLLGIGGMGRVYKAVHPRIGSRVAIKVLSRECSDRRDLVERFFSEAKAVNVVAHENIVNVLDLAVLPDGRPYIVMEYLDGAPLSNVIDSARSKGPLPIGAVARLAVEVLDALAAAHAKGIIHRDLKPDNIYVSPAGRGKVLDFGIAKLQPELGGSATHTGSLLGTPQYMSPEQAAGRSVDARADLYSMGVILFECVTLQKPFSGDSLFDLLKKHIEAPPPMPRALRPDLPPDLEHVILTALAKSPEHRYANAQAMSMALQQATVSLPAAQWAPLQPTPSSPTSGHWDPTPPASWGRTPSIARTTPETRPHHAPQRSLGPWIALSAVVVVGGGIAAIALATGGTKATSETAAQAPVVATPTPPPVVAPPPTPAPIPDPAPAGTPDTDDDELPDLDATSSALIEQALAQTNLPPAAKAAIGKYGSWAKIPPKERQKLTAQLVKSMTESAFDPLGGGPLGAPPPPPPKKSSVADWDPPDLSAPAGWNPKHAQPDKLVGWALAIARKYRSEAQLTRIDVDNVFSDGHADLTLPSFAASTGNVDIRFVAAAPHCYFRVDLDPSDIALREIKGFPCKLASVAAPRCTLAKVWAKALAKQPNLAGKAASMSYYENPVTHHVGWNFTIYEGHTSLYSEMFADDC